MLHLEINRSIKTCKLVIVEARFENAKRYVIDQLRLLLVPQIVYLFEFIHINFKHLWLGMMCPGYTNLIQLLIQLKLLNVIGFKHVHKRISKSRIITY